MGVGMFEASKVVVVAGKGGVGKTTVGAALGLAAARAGAEVLLVELEGHSRLGALFGGGDLGYEPVELASDGIAGRVRGRRITPDEAFLDYLAGHGLHRLTRRLVRTGAIDVITSAAPGIRDLLTLGKIRAVEQSGEADLIVIDAPAAGHALTFLRSAAGMAEAATVGPVREQAEEALALLTDPARCQVVLVALAEETPVTELVETAYSLEDEVGVALGPLVVNAVWPPIRGLDPEPAAVSAVAVDHPAVAAGLRSAAAFRRARCDDQQAQLDRLARELPLPRIVLPQVFSDHLGPDELGVLADALAEQATLPGAA